MSKKQIGEVFESAFNIGNIFTTALVIATWGIIHKAIFMEVISCFFLLVCLINLIRLEGKLWLT